MTAIRLDHVSARTLKPVDLTVAEGELFVLLGPSGAGKSTLLQVIAGLLKYQGHIFFDGQCIDHQAPHQRRVGYLFQDLLLFPHLTIEKNLLLAMAHLKQNHDKNQKQALSLLEMFAIGHLAHRYPRQISGGEITTRRFGAGHCHPTADSTVG